MKKLHALLLTFALTTPSFAMKESDVIPDGKTTYSSHKRAVAVAEVSPVSVENLHSTRAPSGSLAQESDSAAFDIENSRGFISGPIDRCSVEVDDTDHDTLKIKFEIGDIPFTGYVRSDTLIRDTATPIICTGDLDRGSQISWLKSHGGFHSTHPKFLEGALKTVTGFGTGKPTVFKSLNSTAGGMSGVLDVLASDEARFGSWGLSFSSTRKEFKMTNGLTPLFGKLDEKVMTPVKETVELLDKNGRSILKLKLEGFDPYVDHAQTLYNVISDGYIY